MKRQGTALLASLMLLIMMAACGTQQAANRGATEPSAVPTDAAAEASPTPAALGIVEALSDLVESGPSEQQLAMVTDSAPFFEGDSMRVAEGGEAMLNFGDQMFLRLLNDTQLGVVSVQSAPDAPLDIRLFLEEGGFTGDFSTEGGQVVFETPGGAEIVIVGTEFLVVYDAEEGQTTVGNFEGDIELTSAGETTSLEGGFLVAVPDDHAAGDAYPLSADQLAFEALSRELGSPVAAAAHICEFTVAYKEEVEIVECSRQDCELLPVESTDTYNCQDPLELEYTVPYAIEEEDCRGEEEYIYAPDLMSYTSTLTLVCPDGSATYEFTGTATEVSVARSG